ncbi:riboflavin synthase, alpha subunit [Verrucomicrobiia bacterium DG1235]|nr:riboflavin synthase, alpha subunit [Verrucomicrobiae bacterium DG1235]
MVRVAMFTGIVEEKGKVVACEELEGSWRYRVAVEVVGAEISLGDSVAVNGCCLTVVEIGEGVLSFDVLEETRRLTNLRDIAVGSSVNLERSLRFDGRVGGHFVSGHIDGTGVIRTLRPEGKDVILEIEAPEGFEKYLVYKGCIAIDGMSLTVAEVKGRMVTIWLIPHTLEVTSIGEKGVGDAVNLEFDLIAKYTEKIVAQRDA